MQPVARENGKAVASLGTPWEKAYGYAQAVRVKNTIYVSGQLSHDAEGNFVAPAALDGSGASTGTSKMELQMRTTYSNAARVLAQFGAGLQHVVEEVLYVTDMDAAFAVAAAVRKDAYGSDTPECASTIAQVTRLAFAQQLVEISFTAVLPD
jgi:enamine deaminase RidA (YjgF/YER057c/UK114 family)